MGLGIGINWLLGIKIGDFEFGLGIEDWYQRFGLVIWLEDWFWGFELGIGIGDWYPQL